MKRLRTQSSAALFLFTVGFVRPLTPAWAVVGQLPAGRGTVSVTGITESGSALEGPESGSGSISEGTSGEAQEGTSGGNEGVQGPSHEGAEGAGEASQNGNGSESSEGTEGVSGLSSEDRLDLVLILDDDATAAMFTSGVDRPLIGEGAAVRGFARSLQDLNVQFIHDIDPVVARVNSTFGPGPTLEAEQRINAVRFLPADQIDAGWLAAADSVLQPVIHDLRARASDAEDPDLKAVANTYADRLAALLAQIDHYRALHS